MARLAVILPGGSRGRTSHFVPGGARPGVSRAHIEGGNSMLKSALLVTAGIAIGFGANAVLAQSNAPYYLVAEINVKDKSAYEASGVDKVRDGMKANGTAKLIAGGYNKAIAMDADSVANRVLIFQYPSKEAMDKDWKANIEPWEMRADVRKLADFHAIAVEGVEQK
jgi:uncharacterized protein (DUF1330 family)